MIFSKCFFSRLTCILNLVFNCINVCWFFGQVLFIGGAGALLVQSTLKDLGYDVTLGQLALEVVGEVKVGAGNKTLIKTGEKTTHTGKSNQQPGKVLWVCKVELKEASL